MSEPELNFDLPAVMRLGRLPVIEPSADLWQRIVAAHVRRARIRRLALATAGCALAIALLIGTTAGPFATRRAAGVDWQARSQALELQVRALPSRQVNALASDAQAQLMIVDAALQAAYDDGAGRERVNALWEQRSKLLDALLQARRQNVEISRI